MKSRRNYNKSQKRPKRRQNKKNKRRTNKNNKKSFLGIRAFACALRKKFIGGGDFRGEICDFTPLTSADFDALDETVRTPIDSELNLIIPESETCINVKGGNNRVCTKICRISESGNKEVIYRESIKPIEGYTESVKNKHFELFNNEMKLQIYFAEKGLAPNVYMYGLIDVSPSISLPLPPSSSGLSLMPLSSNGLSLMPPRPQSSSQNVKTFAVIDQMNDLFDFFTQYYTKLYNYLVTENPTVEVTDELHYLNNVFNELINKIMILYDEIAELGFVFTDLKPENIVYKQEPDGSFKVFIIDLDTRFMISPPLFNKIWLSVFKESNEIDKVKMRANIMKYLFSTYLIIDIVKYTGVVKVVDMMGLNAKGFNYLHRYAILRYPQKDHEKKTYIVNNPDDSIQFITNMYLMKMLRFIHSKNIGLLKTNAFNIYFQNVFKQDQILLYNYCYLNYDELYNYTGINKPIRI
jgi:hypothetical protein